MRGSVCYVVAAFIANIVIKPLVYRCRPQGAGEGRITPYTWSFPSGHTASDSAFVFSVAKELPPVGGSTRSRRDCIPLVFDPQRETSRGRRARRWCDRTGRGIHRVEGVATRDVPRCAVATGGGRLNLAPYPAPGRPADESVEPIAGRIFSVCGTGTGAWLTAGVPIARSGGQPDPHR